MHRNPNQYRRMKKNNNIGRRFLQAVFGKSLHILQRKCHNSDRTSRRAVGTTKTAEIIYLY
jgi:hypothetical protein